MKCSLIDTKGRSVKLLDLIVDLEDNDYPRVTGLIFQNGRRRPVRLPWNAVKSFDFENKQIKVTDLNEAELGSGEAMSTDVLLSRDVLDALILNLERRSATRANDLWLEESGGDLLLKAADTSAVAVLRRLSLGRFGGKPTSSLYDWKYVEFLRGDPLAVKHGAGYHMRIRLLPPGEIAALSNSLPYLHAAELLTLLPDPIAADTMELMPLDRQIQVFGVLEEQQGLNLLALMAPDAAVDLLGRQEPEAMKRYLELMPKERSDLLIDLLRYPEDTVGGIMTNDMVSIPMGLTIEEAREVLRDRLRDPDFTYIIYVVENDEMRVLRGVTSLREIVMADDKQRLEEIMTPYASTLSPLQSAKSGAYRVLDCHVAALPVIGREGQLLGIVTVDAAVDQAAPEGWRSQAPKVFS